MNILQQDGVELIDGIYDIIKCIDPDDSWDFIFKIRNTIIGKINLTIIGEVNSLFDEKCKLTLNLNKR